MRLTMGAAPNLALANAAATPATMPANFKYAALPTSALAVQPLTRKVPPHVACGLDDPVGDFVPDPTMTDGATNSDDAANIDTSTRAAAPAAVYRTERYATDFHYTLPVPPGGPYLVCLHFAELFDSQMGMRIENVFINDQPVLQNFDILAEAGAMKKALVIDVPNVKPDAHGNVVVRIAAARNSPDQNAKINGIEVLSRQ